MKRGERRKAKKGKPAEEANADKKPKKMKVNQEYVKEKVKSQLKKLASKNRNKHNN